MIGLTRGPWSDEPQIYVLYGDESEAMSWQAFGDPWREGMPVTDPEIEPPAGRFQPTRGLGKLWREHEADVRSPLGWATAEQVAYSAQFQVQSSDGRYPTLYVLAVDGRVYVLYSGGAGWAVRE